MSRAFSDNCQDAMLGDLPFQCLVAPDNEVHTEPTSGGVGKNHTIVYHTHTNTFLTN